MDLKFEALLKKFQIPGRLSQGVKVCFENWDVKGGISWASTTKQQTIFHLPLTYLAFLLSHWYLTCYCWYAYVFYLYYLD